VTSCAEIMRSRPHTHRKIQTTCLLRAKMSGHSLICSTSAWPSIRVQWVQRCLQAVAS
jgi:hypothetical protein